MPASPFYYSFGNETYRVSLHEPPGSPPQVPEALVQDLWRTQHFDHQQLETVGRAALMILKPGRLNTDAGPDFTGARLRIGSTEWAGDVEVHCSSSGWTEHKHHLDPRYNGVVLHVVLHADLQTGTLERPDGTRLPELVLYPHLTTPLRTLLHQYYTSPHQDILCAPQWDDVPRPLKERWIDHLARERMMAKKRRLADDYLATPDLEALLHERLFAGLGYAKNADAMSALARRLPLRMVRRINTPRDVEALHLGTAGLLPTPADLLDTDRATADYAMDLRDRFQRMRHRLDVQPMQRMRWRFFRLRPANFPPLRIVQAAALISSPRGLLHHDAIRRCRRTLEEATTQAELRRLFDITLPAFWDTHVRLTQETRKRSSTIGRARRDVLLVNALAPVLLLYAEQHDPTLAPVVFTHLADLPASRDAVIRRFDELGTRAKSALASQGMHQLFRQYCQETRCLTCSIGDYLLSHS